MAFVITEGVSPWKGFVWALDTVATVGSLPVPDDVAGQAVKVTLELLGVGTLFYALVAVTEVFVAGHLSELLAERREQRMIDALSDHHIICGLGRVGRQVARSLSPCASCAATWPSSREPAKRILRRSSSAPGSIA